MSLATLEDLFVHELRDLYHAEKQLLKALPKMAQAATDENLKAGFEEHLQQTEEHVSRLEKVLESLEVGVRATKCPAMEGLIKEGQKMMEEEADPAVMDAALIATAQKVEHYEISGYGTVACFAQRLGHKDAEKILRQTLDEEKETDRKLTKLAVGGVNEEAVVAGTEDEV